MRQASTDYQDDGMVFGPFRLLGRQKLLFEGDRQVQLGSRALDILITLVMRAGEVVDKNELIRVVWPNIFVDEANLRVHITALRRALGDGQDGARYIVNTVGRGYSFVAPVKQIKELRSELDRSTDRSSKNHNLPTLLTRIVGREEAVRGVIDQLPRYRFVTIVGPGGIGKTTVALAAAERLLETYKDGISFIDLAPIVDFSLAATALASSLGLPNVSSDPSSSITTFLADQKKLIVLDTCEHLAEASAAFAETMLRNCPEIHILATSREPLRAEGEHVYRLLGLECPTPRSTLTAAEAMESPSIRLFAERAASAMETFDIDDSNAPIVAEICSRLAGVPLAIEISASNIGAFGLRGLSQLLADTSLKTQGRRTAVSRHQTLQATLDWSYKLLSEPERSALRRLSIMAGSFTLQAGIAIVEESETYAADVIACLADLVVKSLISADVSGPVALYRMLDTTRAYAANKLDESGERGEIARRHALYFRKLFEQAEAESESTPAAEWQDTYARCIDNLRAALHWAFSPAGDLSLGVALTVASVPLWLHLSLVDECRRCAQRALSVVEESAAIEPRQEMKLRIALGTVFALRRGLDRNRALAIAEELKDNDYQLRALWGLWSHEYFCGDFTTIMEIVARYRKLAERSSDPVDALVGHRMLGMTLHCHGDHAQATRHIEHFLRYYRPPVHRGHILKYQYDQRIIALTTLSVTQWLRGFADQAMRTVRDMIEEAMSGGHALTICMALANSACPLSVVTGDLVVAGHYVDMLLEYSKRYGLNVFHARAQCYHGMLIAKRGEVEAGSHILCGAINMAHKSSVPIHYTLFHTEFAYLLGRAGDTETALEMIGESLEYAQQKEQGVFISEVLRVKGELELMRGSLPETACELFNEAITWAQRHGALAWELRGTMSLANLQARLGQFRQATDALKGVYGKFVEGFETSDLQLAKATLGELESKIELSAASLAKDFIEKAV